MSSGGCSKTCTYKVANTPNCGSNAHVTGSGTSCSCECDSGYSGDPFSGCSVSCSPLTNESPDSSTCKTTSYSCSDGCTGTRTCYKSACTSSEVCYNSSCCTPKWPSYQGYDYNNCITSSDGTVSDGCGNTTTKYKSACTSSQTCNGSGTCVSLSCSDGGYVDSCTPSTSNNGCDKVSCKSVTYGGKTCYIKTETHSTPPASCSTPTCADYYADNTTALGSNYAYQVSGFVTSCANSCGHPATSDTLNCPEGSIILIKCCR